MGPERKGDYYMSETPTTDDVPTAQPGYSDTVNRIEELEAENEALRKRLDTLETAISENRSKTGDTDTHLTKASASEPAEINSSSPSGGEIDNTYGSIGRRGALAGLLGLGILGIGSTPAAAVDPHNHMGEKWTGSPAEGYGLKVKTPNQALVGTATATSGVTAGLVGGAASPDGTGLKGHAFSDTGITTGVKGKVESPKGKGVLGKSVASSGKTFGVIGAANSTQGEGVRGHAQAASGAPTGVYGRADSGDDGAIGVKGEAAASGTAAETTGVQGISNADGDSSTAPIKKTAGVHGRATGADVTHGVLGEVDSEDGQGVVGRNSTRDYVINSSFPNGTTGITDRSGADTNVTEASGVRGASLASSGAAYGVKGTTASPDGAGIVGVDTSGNGYGVISFGDSKTEGNSEVTGSQSVGTVGAEAHLGSDQTTQDSTLTTVQFDQVDHDDFGGFDATTGEYTVQDPGDYHISFAVSWANGLNGDTVDYNFFSDGVDFIARKTGSLNRTNNLSKTAFGMSQGDVIKLAVRQFSGGTADIEGSSRGDTFITIHKVG